MWMFHKCKGGIILYRVDGASGVERCIQVSQNGQPVIMQEDTGACVSVIGQHLYKTVFNGVVRYRKDRPTRGRHSDPCP
jgi:hypothetical protein